MGQLLPLQQVLGHEFSDRKLLEQALRHRSVGINNNERLEFLGDAVLSIIITDELYRQYPTSREGDLSRMRSMLVNGSVLSELSIALTVNQHLTLGAGEQQSGVDQRQSILADALEAVIGALYLDAGLELCREVVLRWYRENVAAMSSLSPKKDPKSLLQEWCQANSHPLPGYQCEVSGLVHQQIFHVTCAVEGLDHIVSAEGLSRRKAEQEAARLYLEWLYES